MGEVGFCAWVGAHPGLRSCPTRGWADLGAATSWPGTRPPRPPDPDHDGTRPAVTDRRNDREADRLAAEAAAVLQGADDRRRRGALDRKSTRLNSSHW